MARRYRIPGLIDLTFVSDPEEIRALAADPALDRRFLRRGPLVNRLIAGRIPALVPGRRRAGTGAGAACRCRPQGAAAVAAGEP